MIRNEDWTKQGTCVYPVKILKLTGSYDILISDDLGGSFRYPESYTLLLDSAFNVDYLCVRYPEYFSKTTVNIDKYVFTN